MASSEELLRTVAKALAPAGAFVVVDAAGLTIDALAPPQLEAAAREPLERALKGEAVRDGRADVDCPDGGRCGARVEAAPVRDPEGAIIGAWATIRVGDGARGDERSRLEAVFSAFPDLFFRFDRNGIYREAMAGHGADLIMPLEQIMGRSLDELMPPEVAARSRELIDAALRTGKPQTLEYSLKLPGGPTYFEARLAPLTDDEVVAVVRNVTERRRSEDVLRFLVASGEELTDVEDLDRVLERLAQLAVPALGEFCVVDIFSAAGRHAAVSEELDDPEGVRRILDGTPRVDAQKGYFADAVRLRKPVTVLDVGPQQAARFAAKGIRWLADLGIVSYMLAPVFVRGQLVGGIVVGAMRRDRRYGVEDERLLETLARRAALAIENVQLVEDERAARWRAEKRERQLLALLESMWEGAVVFGGEGEIILRNRAMNEMFAAEPGAPLRKEDYEVLLPDLTPVPFEQWPFNRAGRGESFSRMEVIVRRPGVVERRMAVSSSVVRSESGKPLVGIMVTHDLTELRRLEADREDFVRTISHDLRQPLSSISNTAELLVRRLRKAGLEAEARRADLVLRNVGRLNAMIADLVDSSRLEAGALELHRGPLDLGRLAGEAVSALVSLRDQERIELRIPEPSPRVQADAGKLERVVTNLLTNALKYSPSGSPVVVTVAERDGEALLSVQDFGRGIPPQEMPQLFQRYFRASTAGPREGVGLGLYIARLLAEAHGGRVWATSELGRGSTFWMALPALPREGVQADEGLQA